MPKEHDYFINNLFVTLTSNCFSRACQEKKFSKDDRHATQTFCLSLLKKRDASYTVVSKTKKKKSIYLMCRVFATFNALSKLINGWIMKLEGLVYCFNKLYCLFESFISLNLNFLQIAFFIIFGRRV